MKTKLPFLVRATLALIALFAYIFMSADNRWDGLFNSFLIYPLALVVGWFSAGILYNLFLGQKVIKATPQALRDSRPTNSEGDSLRDRTVGYYFMQAAIIAGLLVFTIAKHIEIRGMQKAEKYWLDKKAKQ